MPEYVTSVPVVMYVAYILCYVMTSVYMSTFGVLTIVRIKIGVGTTIGINIPVHQKHVYNIYIVL